MSEYAIRLQAAYIAALANGFTGLASAFGEMLKREVKLSAKSLSQ